MIDAEHLILTQGAYEYVPPFPGWTLPGVMTPGAAQLTVKTMHVLPGRKILVAGTGPFLLVAADQLHRAGGNVVAVVEMATRLKALVEMPGLLRHFGLFWEGVGYVYRLRRAGIPIYSGHIVIEAKGNEEITEVIIAPCDDRGYPDRSRSWAVAVDTLCVGYGFIPRTQLAQLAGCRMIFAEAMGGWFPEVDENLHTNIPGIWVGGDGAGVGGALTAQLQGTLAGIGVARELGAIDQTTFERKRRAVSRKLESLNRFRAALRRLCPLRPGLQALVTKETVVCRCEEVTLDEVEAGVEAGGTDIRTLKVVTRLGMGPCQGVMCWPATARLIAARIGKSIEAVGPLSVRQPVAPLRMGDLAELRPPV
jgi:NADPH-dependent 2,4-dienoyl-CoA reductase/sulfur reductase-like enzyme